MPPRNVAGPTVRGSDFWGREQDVQLLWDVLDRGSVLLTAPRRWGKSSLMNALSDQPRDGWAVCYLDVEYVETPSEFLTELTAALLQMQPIAALLRKVKEAPGAFSQWVTRALGEVGFNLGVGEVKLKLRDELKRPEAWPELTEQLLHLLSRMDRSLLIIVDEFPMMISNFLDKDDASGLHFLKWFRAQRRAKGGPQVRFLLGGSVNIEPRLEQLANEALLNDLERFPLRPLSRSVAAQFVREVLGAEKVAFEESAPEEVVAVTGVGVHFFLQVLISECLSEVRRQGEGAVLSVADVRPIYESRVLGPPSRARFSHYHSRLRTNFGRYENAARLILAELTKDEPRSLQQLDHLLRSQGEAEIALDEVVARLEGDYYVLREGDGVRFLSHFLRDWWLRNAPFPRRRG